MAEKSIGALWTGKGKVAFSGNIELTEGQKISVVVFANDRKEGNQPDYRIYKQRSKSQQELPPTPPEEHSDLEPF